MAAVLQLTNVATMVTACLLAESAARRAPAIQGADAASQRDAIRMGRSAAAMVLIARLAISALRLRAMSLLSAAPTCDARPM